MKGIQGIWINNTFKTRPYIVGLIISLVYFVDVSKNVPSTQIPLKIYKKKEEISDCRVFIHFLVY